MLDLERKSFENTTFPMQDKREPDRYKCELFRGHIIAYLWGKVVLIDTGSERSYGSFTTHLLGQIERPRSIIGSKVSLDTIEKFIGFPICGLLGMDLLSKVDWSINLEREEFIIYSERPAIDKVDVEVPVSDFLGVPSIPLKIDGKECEAILDTGAQISYVNPYFVEGQVPTRCMKDFSPLVGGWFKTPVFKKTLSIEGAAVEIEVGTLPSKMAFILGCFAQKEILGNELLNYFEAIFLFRGREKKLLLKRLEGANEEESL